jgi:hypothetical protein
MSEDDWRKFKSMPLQPKSPRVRAEWPLAQVLRSIVFDPSISDNRRLVGLQQ